MKRALQASDNSSSQRPRIDMPATAAPPPGTAATLLPTVSAADQKRRINLLLTQQFFYTVANSDLTALTALKDRCPLVVEHLINANDRVSGLTPLMLAVKSHNAETASWLISQGANLNLPCARGTSALMYAAKRGDCAMLQLLLAAGAAIGQADPEQRTALHHAAMQGQEKTVALLLDQGAALEHQDADGNTALLLAVFGKHATVTSLLVERGANVAHVNRIGLFPLAIIVSEAITIALLQKPVNLQQHSAQCPTALIGASALGECRIATLLLDHGADIEFCCNQDGTALAAAINKDGTALAAAIRHKQHDMVKLLLERGANPSRTIASSYKFLCTMLGYAAHFNDTATMELLVQAGADIDQCTKETATALVFAALADSKDAVQWLLARKASVDADASSGYTALFIASHMGHVEIVELLLQHRASLADLNAEGMSAFHGAVFGGKDRCVALLLKNGANVHQRTGDGLFPLHLAAKKGYEKTIALLLDQGVDVDQADGKGYTALMHTAHFGHLPALKFLLSKKASCDTRTAKGHNALHIAAQAGKDEVLAELLKQQDTDISSVDNLGGTALMIAAERGWHDAVYRLLDNGADPCTVSQKGWNALHFAASNGHVTVVETLINGENDIKFIDYPNPDGFTPLLLAAQKGKVDVVRLLVERGANFRLCEKGGHTALYHGALFGHSKVVELLMKMRLLQVPGSKEIDLLVIQGALAGAIAKRHAGVVEVFLRSKPDLASLDLQWHASPVILDLRNNVNIVIAPQQAMNEQVDQFTGLGDCVRRLELLLDLSAAEIGDDHQPLAQQWLAYTRSYAVIAEKLQEATKSSAALRHMLAGTVRQISPAQNRLVCAGILASLGEPSVFGSPYSGTGLSPEAEACFNSLALHHARLLSQVAEQAEQGLVIALGNLHGTCMGSFTGKPFHPIDLYVYLTRQCGLYDIPAKRISDAFAEIWVQHKQSDTAVRERALAQALNKRYRSGEMFEQVRHDSPLSGNEKMFHWLLNRQLDLINAWHKRVLETGAE